MAHVSRGVTKTARHKKILGMAKGMRGRAGTCYRIAHERVEKSLQYAYRDRRKKKSDFRSLWIARINAAVRELGMTYSVFMNAMAKANVALDRKVLADMAVNSPAEFKAVVENAKRFIKEAK